MLVDHAKSLVTLKNMVQGNVSAKTAVPRAFLGQEIFGSKSKAQRGPHLAGTIFAFTNRVFWYPFLSHRHLSQRNRRTFCLTTLITLHLCCFMIVYSSFMREKVRACHGFCVLVEVLFCFWRAFWMSCCNRMSFMVSFFGGFKNMLNHTMFRSWVEHVELLSRISFVPLKHSRSARVVGLAISKHEWFLWICLLMQRFQVAIRWGGKSRFSSRFLAGLSLVLVYILLPQGSTFKLFLGWFCH